LIIFRQPLREAVDQLGRAIFVADLDGRLPNRAATASLSYAKFPEGDKFQFEIRVFSGRGQVSPRGVSCRFGSDRSCAECVKCAAVAHDLGRDPRECGAPEMTNGPLPIANKQFRVFKERALVGATSIVAISGLMSTSIFGQPGRFKGNMIATKKLKFMDQNGYQAISQRE
jgi:hypothetical protein